MRVVPLLDLRRVIAAAVGAGAADREAHVALLAEQLEQAVELGGARMRLAIAGRNQRLLQAFADICSNCRGRALRRPASQRKLVTLRD
jgi:hypothetical protein